MKNATIKLDGNMSRAQSDALRAIGIVADVRGGNPIVRLARDRYSLACGRARHTAFFAILSKADGSQMTAADIRIARSALVNPMARI